MTSERDIDINDVLRHELSPEPTLIFTDVGDMRVSKAELKTKLQVEASSRIMTQDYLCNYCWLRCLLGDTLARNWNYAKLCD